jgi:lysophospholipase L1-like esterase
LFITAAILFAATEWVLRARWEPRARTLSPFVKTRTVTPEYNVEYETNGQGFRDVSRMDGFNRVAFVGDSFVFGSGVAFDSVVTQQLHRRLWKLPTLAAVHNFGVPGSGPFNALYLWREQAGAIRPHILVVALYAGNDAPDALREAREARPRLVTVARMKTLWHRLRAWRQNRQHADPVENIQAQQRRRAHGWNAFGIENPARIEHLIEIARKRGVPADTIRARLDAIPDTLVADALAFRSNPFNLADAVLDPDGLRHNLLLDTPKMGEGWAALESALRELEREVAVANADSHVATKLVLVCIPAAVQVDATYWWLRNLGVRLDRRVIEQPVFQARLAAFASRENIPLIDLLPVMRAHPEQRLYYEQDGHWSAAGHRVAAQAIADRIREMLPVIENPVPVDSTAEGMRY